MASEIKLKPNALHPGQQFIRNNKKKFNVLSCGRRFGKSVYMLDEAIFEPKGILDGFPIGWASPTRSHFEQVWDEALKMYRPIIASSSKQDQAIRFINGAQMDFWTLHNTDTPGRGYKYSKLFFDEAAFASKLRDQWEMSMSACLADYDGEAWFGSTPNGMGYFKDLYDRGNDDNFKDWASFKMPTSANTTIPNLDKFLEQQKGILPSLVFAQEHLAEFVNFSGSLVLRNMLHYGRPSFGSNYKVSIGIDLAASLKNSADYNAMVATTRINGRIYVLDAVRVKGLPNDVKAAMYRFFDKWNPAHIYIEAVGYQIYGVHDLIQSGKVSYPIRTINPQKMGDKLTRFLPVVAKYENHMMVHAPDLENSDFENEIISFSGDQKSGGHDDFVDALVYSMKGLDQLHFLNAPMGFRLDF